MKCLSCEVEINPKWKHAIDINVCPFCGKPIMDEQLKGLLTSLGEAMTKLQEYPEQLSDWLLVNFNFIKTDSPDLIKYVPKQVVESLVKVDKPVVEDHKKYMVKVKTDAGEMEVEAEKIQSEEKTNEFFKRADAIKPNIDGFQNPIEKTQHLKKMALQIRKASGNYAPSSEDEDMVVDDLSSEIDSEMASEMSDLFTDGNIKSSLDNSVDEEIPSVVLNMAKRAKNGQSKNASDLLKLQKMQDRLLESRKNFENGGGKGSFTRV